MFVSIAVTTAVKYKLMVIIYVCTGLYTEIFLKIEGVRYLYCKYGY